MAGDKATISRESFYKSLGKLEALAGVQQQTQQTQQPQLNPDEIIEKMQKGEQLTAEEMDLVKSQICTGPNSERTTWPGGTSTDIPGNGPGADKIKPNGTDYNERGMRKSIAEKVAKGLPLTADELALLKSDLEKGDGGEPVKKSTDDEEKEKFSREMGKSLTDHVQENETLQKGIEVSEFLSEFAKSFGAATEASESRTMSFVQDIGQQLFNAVHEFKAEQADFNKSLAEAVLNIGHGVAGSMEQVQQVADMPAGPPRSQQLRAIPGGQNQQGFVQKSLGGGPGEGISKSMMTETMTDMLEKGEGGISPVEIIKFDSTGEIRPELQAKVLARIQGAGQ